MAILIIKLRGAFCEPRKVTVVSIFAIINVTAEQKEYLEDKFQEIDETKNKLLKVKDPKEKAELSKNLQALNEKLYEWREETTTVKVEGTALGEDDN